MAKSGCRELDEGFGRRRGLEGRRVDGTHRYESAAMNGEAGHRPARAGVGAGLRPGAPLRRARTACSTSLRGSTARGVESRPAGAVAAMPRHEYRPQTVRLVTNLRAPVIGSEVETPRWSYRRGGSAAAHSRRPPRLRRQSRAAVPASYPPTQRQEAEPTQLWQTNPQRPPSSGIGHPPTEPPRVAVLEPSRQRRQGGSRRLVRVRCRR